MTLERRSGWLPGCLAGRLARETQTGWLADSQHIGEEVVAMCNHSEKAFQEDTHRHLTLANRRANARDVDPSKPSRAILKGLRRQLENTRVLGEGIWCVCQEVKVIEHTRDRNDGYVGIEC